MRFTVRLSLLLLPIASLSVVPTPSSASDTRTGTHDASNLLADAPSDLDHDGISDDLENRLISRYSPQLYFQDNEIHWPCAAIWFVEHCDAMHLSYTMHTDGGVC